MKPHEKSLMFAYLTLLLFSTANNDVSKWIWIALTIVYFFQAFIYLITDKKQ